MKRFLLPLVALCLLAPNVQAQDEKKAPEPPIQEMANGLQIQIYNSVNSDEMKDDIAEMLGIRIWKFRVSSLPKNQKVMLRLEVHTPGKEAVTFNGLIMDTVEKFDLIYGLQPIEGNDLTTSPKTRVYNRSSYYIEGVENRSPGDTNIYPNPFLGLGQHSIYRDPPVRPDGSILLMRFSPSGKFDDPKNSELVVVATLQDPPPAK